MNTGKKWDRIVKLDDTIDIDGFACGEPEIDIWLHKDALEQQEERGCTVYVAVAPDCAVVGFFSLSMHYLQKRTVPDDVKTGSAFPATFHASFLAGSG